MTTLTHPKAGLDKYARASTHRAGRILECPPVRLACLALLAILSATVASAQPAECDATHLVISVDTHRPLWALADELQKRCRIVITYEEAPWVAPTDIEEVNQAIIGAGKPAPPMQVLAPRKAAVAFEYVIDSGKRRPTEDADLLAALLHQYEAADAPGEFRVEGENGLYHLIPSRLKNGQDQWVDAAPVFSKPVNLADRERTVNDTLDEIVAQLNECSPVKVGWGFVPLNFFVQTRIRLAANAVPARQVMRQILEQLPRSVTWRLNYDPTTKQYYLSFLILPERR